MKMADQVWIGALSVLLWLGFEVAMVSGIPPPWVRTWRFPGKNIDADLLVLDYGSLSPSTVVDTEDKCELACKSILGCNAYVYCADKTGCGKSCATYVASNPKLAAPANGEVTYKSQALPITGFGYFQSGNGCIGSKWKYGLCSLKKVADDTAPKFSTQETGGGWRSGVINITSAYSCAGEPLGFCELCTNYYPGYGNPGSSWSQCMDCGKTVTKSLPGGKASTLEQATKAWSCAWCFNKSPGDAKAERSQCFNCVPKYAAKGLHNLCAY